MGYKHKIVKEEISVEGGRATTFDVYLPSEVELPSPTNKFKSKRPVTIHEKSVDAYNKANIAIDNLYNNTEVSSNYRASKKAVRELVLTILHDDFTIRSFMSVINHRDCTPTHSLNVAIYALSLGSYLKLKKEALLELGESALLHDLGKNKIDEQIVNKNDKLSTDEYEVIKEHSKLGHDICIEIGITNKNTLDGIIYHHEKIDGTGYPSGLKGEDIPLFARIIGICDTFDALTSQRSYKEAFPTFEALKHMKIEMKNYFDTDLVNKMIMMFR